MPSNSNLLQCAQCDSFTIGKLDNFLTHLLPCWFPIAIAMASNRGCRARERLKVCCRCVGNDQVASPCMMGFVRIGVGTVLAGDGYVPIFIRPKYFSPVVQPFHLWWYRVPDGQWVCLFHHNYILFAATIKASSNAFSLKKKEFFYVTNFSY